MTQEEKQILLRGLCARLPYGVYVDAYSWQKDTPKLLIECVPEYVGEEIVVKGLAGRHSIREIKPYLRPMSSMTEGEILEFIRIGDSILRIGEKKLICILSLKQMDWLNAHHFDYRIDPSTGKTLIESNLAIEAPKDMYKNE
jgi:hypothetical protein